MIKLQPLFKYIGSKHRSANRIIATFPANFDTYYEPFFGSGAVLGHLRPPRSIVCDICKPLIDLWKLVQLNPQSLVGSYQQNWEAYQIDRQTAYEQSKTRFNEKHNPHDFLFISRACYGGLIRFTKEGFFSTPLGPHQIISPTSFAKRLYGWRAVVANTRFIHGDFSEIICCAKENDIVYCDPPYIDSQKIIYGAQEFDFQRLYKSLYEVKKRGAFIALSVDGVKKSGARTISVFPPKDLFEVETYINLGGSMLKRFWRGGQNVLDEHVRDRLLLSVKIDREQADLFN